MDERGLFGFIFGFVSCLVMPTRGTWHGADGMADRNSVVKGLGHFFEGAVARGLGGGLASRHAFCGAHASVRKSLLWFSWL